MCEPLTIGVCCDASEMHASGCQFDEEEHVERLQTNGLDGEEIAGEELLFVVAHELAPTDGAETHRCGQDVMSFEDIADGALADVEAQFL